MDSSLQRIRCRQCGRIVPSNNIKYPENICQDCFLEENKPTCTPNRPWINVYNPAKRKDQLDPAEFTQMIKARHRLTRKDDKFHLIDENERTQLLDLTPENIDFLARNMNFTEGKWLIFQPESQIDEVWLKVAKAIIHGQLSSVPSAKVSTTPKDENYVICVYTDDYLDEDAVMKVRERLRDLGIDWLIFYKPDIYTHLRIYSRTTSLPAHRYKA